MPIPIPIIVAGITAAAGAGGAALDRGGSRRAIDRQNEYNTPANQVKRLREAGLPYAAMTSGNVGNQSQAQTETRSGVGESVRGGIDKFIETTMQKKQLELMAEQIEMVKQQRATEEANTRKTWADALMSDTRAKVETDLAQWRLNREGSDLTMPGDLAPSNQIQAQVREANLQQAHLDSQKIQNELKAIERNVQSELYNDGTLTNKTRQELVNLVMQSDTMKAQQRLMGQNFDIIEMQRKVEKTLINALEKDGMSTGEAFMHTLLQGTLGAQFIPKFN